MVYMHSKRSLHFHFTRNVSKLLTVVIYREYNLVCKHNKSIRNDGKGFHSPIFVLEESHCTSSMFVSLMTNAPKCTSRWCLSTGHFFQATEKTFTQNAIEYGLLENCSFDFKFNVPVGFWMAIFELSSNSKKLKRFRTFEWYFRKQLTIGVNWAKYEKPRNFTTVLSFSLLREIGSSECRFEK